MKKIIFGLALLIAGVCSADSYLYWMIDTESAATGSWDYDSARIVAARTYWADQQVILTMTDLTGKLLTGKTSVDEDEISAASLMDGGFGASIASSGTYGNGISYWVELLNDGEVVAHSEYANKDGLTYAQAAAYIQASGMSPASSPWLAGNFQAGAIPEPTSGLLLLIGMAGLALRRKRRA